MDKVQLEILENSSNEQEYIVDVPFEVTDLTFDPERNIISANTTTSVFSDYFKPYLSPNPASTAISAVIPSGVAVKQALFFNAIGQKVNETHEKSTWDISNLATGVYFIVLETTKGTTELKFIKN